MIGMLALTSIPTVIGVAEGVSEQRKQNQAKADETRMAKFYLDVRCEDDPEEARNIRGKRVVVRDNKVYLDEPNSSLRSIPSHTVQAFYVNYPDDEREPTLGLVSTVSDDPPMLNWIYVDKNTMELKYGNRTQSREHHVGPWDWTEDRSRLVIENQELFASVEEEPGVWAVYYDRNDDGLNGVVGREKSVVEISLERKLLDKENSG